MVRPIVLYTLSDIRLSYDQTTIDDDDDDVPNHISLAAYLHMCVLFKLPSFLSNNHII